MSEELIKKISKHLSESTIGDIKNKKNEKNKKNKTEHDFVGLTTEEALALANEYFIEARIVSEDGIPNWITMDIREGRVNLFISKGFVERVEIE